MLRKQDQLTELVRTLEENEYVFASDPLLITEKMQNEGGTPIQKLHRRALRIDSSGVLTRTLSKIEGRIKGIILVMSVLWCVSGFLGLFTLLQSNVVNFFYVLVCLLGFHSIMLIGWIVLTLINQGTQSPSVVTSFINPKALIRGKDAVTVAATDLYERQLNHAGMRWYLSKFSHQLWLATLTGMLLAILFLLIVRQYSFSWESTLLADSTLMALTKGIGWLPSTVGFAVPDADAITQSRLASDAMPLSIARQWASLLIGSLLMYGIVPRVLAWAFCALMFRRKKMTLDINLPYYQKILNFWQREVVDADDFVEEVVPVAPIAKVASGKKLVALLEYPYSDANWYQKSTEESDTESFGIIDERDDMTRLVAYLQTHDVQVLLGIHASALPDRGTMRKLDKIASYAKGGLIVQLLDEPLIDDDKTLPDINLNSNEAVQTDSQLRHKQWQQALQQRNIGLLS